MDNPNQIPAETLFREAMEHVKLNYKSFCFFAERDSVWTVQKKLITLASANFARYQVINEYRMPQIPGIARSKVDLVVIHKTTEVSNAVPVELAVEFKYQWKRGRPHVLDRKFPLIFWSGKSSVLADIEKASGYCEKGLAKCAIAILIDEDGYFHNNHPEEPTEHSEWQEWKISAETLAPVWVLWTIYGTE
jgi:hypothetical protein